MTGPSIGLMLPTAAATHDGHIRPDRAVDAARRAEGAGFDGVYVGDHLMHPHPLLESVVTLSVVAAATDRVALGPCVMLMALRQPLLLARQLWTLSQFAPGRLRVGVGVGGEYPAEFEAAGVARAERGSRMEAALEEVRRFWSEGAATGSVSGPAGPLPPFLLAGHSERALRRAATCGDGWIGYLLGVESFSRRKAFLSECRAGSGLDRRPFVTGMLLPVHVTDDRPGARAEAAAEWSKLVAAADDLPERLFVAGPAGQIAEQLHAYWAAGCTEFMLAPADQGAGYPGQVDRLAESVLPLVRAFD